MKACNLITVLVRFGRVRYDSTCPTCPDLNKIMKIGPAKRSLPFAYPDWAGAELTVIL